jgi:hypothetical protein
MKKEHKFHLGFVVFFLTVIYSVPVVQGIIDYRKNKAVQAFDIVTDALLTPYHRAVRLHELAQRQLFITDSLCGEIKRAPLTSFDTARVERLVDAARTIYEDMKRARYVINRHITIDSLRPSILDTASSVLRGGLTSNDSIALGKLRTIAGDLAGEYRFPGFFEAPVLCIKNLKYILWNDRYLRPFEKEMENNSMFAGISRELMQHAWYVVFKDLGSKGVLGLSNWYFYTLDVDYLVKPSVIDKRSISVDPNDRPLTDDPIRSIVTFSQQLSRRGIDLLVVIVPGKPSIYPDVLSKRVSRDRAATFSHSNEIINELRKRNVNTVDLFGPFAQERFKDDVAGDSLYLHQDTHWKARALRCAARIVARRIKSFPWYGNGTVEYAIDSTTSKRVGDVAVMSSLALLGKVDPARLPVEKTKCFQVFRVFRDPGGNIERRVLYKDDFRSSQILVLGDSFSRIYQTDDPGSAGWIAHLACELSQPVASIVNDGGASTLARRSLARRVNLLTGKKLVVWEIVERDFRFGEDGWKDVEL